MGEFEVQVEIVANPAGRFDYVITTSTGYRATMERCDRDCCVDGHMPACARPLNWEHMHSSGAGSGSVDLWLKHSAKVCHGWHDERVAAFVASVRRTHGSWRPFTAARACTQVSTAGRPAVLAKLLGWTVEDVEDELAKAAA